MISFGYLSRIFVILNILLTLVNTALAEISVRPDDAIFDEARVFSDEARTALSSDLQHALGEHELEVYVATFRLVKGESIAQRAARLRNAWAQSPYAVVLVYDESVDQISLVGSRDLAEFVSHSQLGAVFQRAAASANHYLTQEAQARRKPDPAVMISRAVHSLLGDPVLTDRMTLSEPFRFTRSMGILLVILLLFLCLAGLIVGWLEGRLQASKRSRTRCSYFPTTHMPLRLGAPYSGGQGATFGE